MAIPSRVLKKKKSDPSRTVCPDGHLCENHAECVENPVDETNYFCDCDASALLWDEAFAGLSCEHKATTYCKHDNMFCTNGGTCKRRHASDNTKYTECECTDGYEGSHCQFVAGSTPRNWPTSAASTVVTSAHQSDGISTGGTVAIVVVVLAVLVGAALFAWRFDYFGMKEKTHNVLDGFIDANDSEHGDRKNENKIPSKELELDADGGKLRKAMEAQGAGDIGDDMMENEEGEGVVTQMI